jgi:hypothetical protein
MNPTTKAFLRNAVLEAVNTEQDLAAMELLFLLNGKQLPGQSQPQERVQLPEATQEVVAAGRQIIDGPARSFHYWASFIRENFIPFMVRNGRARFTSSELFSWLENNPAVCMTTAEVERRSDGHEYWRNIVSNALTALKEGGLVEAQSKSRVYVIAGR